MANFKTLINVYIVTYIILKLYILNSHYFFKIITLAYDLGGTIYCRKDTRRDDART